MANQEQQQQQQYFPQKHVFLHVAVSKVRTTATVSAKPRWHLRMWFGSFRALTQVLRAQKVFAPQKRPLGSPSWSKISNEKMLFRRSGSTKIMKVLDLKKPHANLLQWFCVVHSFDHSGESLESVLLCSSHLCKLIYDENVVSLQGLCPLKRLPCWQFPKLLWLGALISPFCLPRKQQQGRVRHTLQRSLSLLGPEVLNWNKPSRIFPDFCDSGGPLRDWHSWSRYCPSSVDLPSSTCRKKTSRVYRIPPSLGFFGVGHDKWKAGKQWRNWFSVKNATLRPATVVLSQ